MMMMMMKMMTMMTIMMMTMMIMMMIEKWLSHKCMSAKLSRRGPTPSIMKDEEYTVKIPCNCAMQPHTLSVGVSLVFTGVLSPRFSQYSPLPFPWH